MATYPLALPPNEIKCQACANTYTFSKIILVRRFFRLWWKFSGKRERISSADVRPRYTMCLVRLCKEQTSCRKGTDNRKEAEVIKDTTYFRGNDLMTSVTRWDAGQCIWIGSAPAIRSMLAGPQGAPMTLSPQPCSQLQNHSHRISFSVRNGKDHPQCTVLKPAFSTHRPLQLPLKNSEPCHPTSMTFTESYNYNYCPRAFKTSKGHFSALQSPPASIKVAGIQRF